VIKLRLYTASDQSEIERMIQSIATEFEQPISSPNKPSTVVLDRYWVAIHDKEIVGTIGVLKLAPKSAVLKRMFVQKEYRGKDYGISASLLNEVLVWSSFESIDTIYLGTMSQFKAAHKFYEKHGFKVIGWHNLPASFVANPIDDVFYVKMLQ
jgi:GNAT superfamily N-acetyltransferase